MRKPVVTVRRETSLAEIARIMLSQGIGCVPVVDDDGKLRGIVTESDFSARERGMPFSLLILPPLFGDSMPREVVEQIRREAETTAAKEIMITALITAVEDTPAEEVARQMLRHDIDHIPVVRDGVPVGIVSRHDFLRMIVGEAGSASSARPSSQGSPGTVSPGSVETREPHH